MRVVAALLLVEIVAGSPAAASSDSEGRAILRAAGHAMGRLHGVSAIDAEGTVDAGGLTGRYSELTRLRDGAFVTRSAYHLFSEADGYDGQRRWKQDRSGGSHWLNAPFTVADSVTSAWLHRRGYLQPAGARIELLAHEDIAGRPATVLTMRPRGGNSIRLAFDDASHLLVRADWDRPFDVITRTYSDYRRVGPFKTPFHIEDEESGDKTVVRIGHYERIADSTAAQFARPRPRRDTAISASAAIPLDAFDYAVVPAQINGHQYDFVVDTGGHDIVLPDIATELGLNTEGQGSSGGSGPGRVATSDTQVAELKLGAATMTNQHFAVLDLGTGLQAKGKPKRAGIVGLEIFERMAVTIDEPHNRLTLEPFTRDRRCQGESIPLMFDDDQPAVRGTIDGIPAQIGIDVGNAGIPIVLWRWAEAHHVADKYRQGTESGGSGVGGSNTTYRTSHHEVRIGRTTLSDVDVNYATTPTGYFSSRADSMNLGRALLQKYAVRFDYSRGEMCIIRPAA